MKRFILGLIGLAILVSCGDISDDELWYKGVKLDDGSHVMVYHNKNCPLYNDYYFHNSVNKLHFVMRKYEVFDFCISQRDIKMLNAISKRNAEQYEEDALIDAAGSNDMSAYRRFVANLDTSSRDYKVFFSIKGDSLIKLEEPFIPTRED